MFSGFFLAALSVMLAALAIEDLHRNAVSGAHLTAVSVWVITGHAADMVMGGPDIWPVSLRAGTEAGIVMLAGAVIWSLVMGRLTGRLPLGGADIKLLSIGALCLGLARALVGLCAAALSAAFYLSFRMIVGKQKKELPETIPFVPFLVIGFIAAYIAGKQIISWYTA